MPLVVQKLKASGRQGRKKMSKISMNLVSHRTDYQHKLSVEEAEFFFKICIETLKRLGKIEEIVEVIVFKFYCIKPYNDWVYHPEFKVILVQPVTKQKSELEISPCGVSSSEMNHSERERIISYLIEVIKTKIDFLRRISRDNAKEMQEMLDLVSSRTCSGKAGVIS